MTDEVQAGTEWVPRFGMLEVPSDRAALIRGLFELAAFVADHPELPLPDVQASISTGTSSWQSKRAAVDQVAALLGETAVDYPEFELYEVEALFGPIRFYSVAFTVKALADRLGHVSASDTTSRYTGGGAR